MRSLYVAIAVLIVAVTTIVRSDEAISEKHKPRHDGIVVTSYGSEESNEEQSGELRMRRISTPSDCIDMTSSSDLRCFTREWQRISSTDPILSRDVGEITRRLKEVEAEYPAARHIRREIHQVLRSRALRSKDARILVLSYESVNDFVDVSQTIYDDARILFDAGGDLFELFVYAQENEIRPDTLSNYFSAESFQDTAALRIERGNENYKSMSANQGYMEILDRYHLYLQSRHRLFSETARSLHPTGNINLPSVADRRR